MQNEIVLYQPDATIQLEVRLQDDTVWLTQQQMAELFQKDISVISRHIKNIFTEGEVDEKSNLHFLQIPNSDRPARLYDLDVIISVGYRVKSKQGVQFRRWATSILKEYLLRGYSFNQRLMAMEEKMDKKFHSIENTLADHQEKIDFFVRTSLPPVEKVFFNGEFFEARVLLEKIIKTARRRVIIIDAYIDASTFEMLDVRAKGVKADIYSGLNLRKLQKLHNDTAGVEPIDTHIWKNASHDRWIIADDNLYHCGPSLKDAGQKLGAVAQFSLDAEDILKHVR
ncbi:MAG: virulence RhuM family protein [Paludibacteraceae bacterium]|nr:virulence RhuM family protein [Paludibacteraceae bacterium]